MERFSGQVQAELEAGDYRRILLDLRNNGGGSDGVIWPLLEVLRQEMDRGTEVVGLIGETTFSSAIINGRRASGDGSGAGGRPDQRQRGPLWVSGLLPPAQLRATGGLLRKYIDLGTLLDADAGRGVEPLEPDVLVPQTMEDTLEGRDTAVEWLLANPQRLEPKGIPWRSTDSRTVRGSAVAGSWKSGRTERGDCGCSRHRVVSPSDLLGR